MMSGNLSSTVIIFSQHALFFRSLPPAHRYASVRLCALLTSCPTSRVALPPCGVGPHSSTYEKRYRDYQYCFTQRTCVGKRTHYRRRRHISEYMYREKNDHHRRRPNLGRDHIHNRRVDGSRGREQQQL